MSSSNRRKLEDRVLRAAEAALTSQNHVSVVDVFVRMGWLDPGATRRWQQGQIPYLEASVQANPLRVSEALELFRSWATGKSLLPSETDYVAQNLQRQRLRFSASGDPSTEQAYRTHWMSPTLSEKKRGRLAEKVNRAPELVVIQPLSDDWKCCQCGNTGNLLSMTDQGPTCLGCAGLDDLAFLPAGDALVTRRAKAGSSRYAVVVRFSRSAGRYERQGLLVEPQTLVEVRASGLPARS
jgi:hypothetical protein